MTESSRYYTAAQKHKVLTHYRRHTHGAGFDALAARFSIAGGGRTIQRWYGQWDGTPASLHPSPRPGRPLSLTPAEITQHIFTPIKRSNRKPEAVHYTELLPAVQQHTGKAVSLRSVQRYGQKILQATKKRTQKRTRQECK
jgi:hypothetical protein